MRKLFGTSMKMLGLLLILYLMFSALGTTLGAGDPVVADLASLATFIIGLLAGVTMLIAIVSGIVSLFQPNEKEKREDNPPN